MYVNPTGRFVIGGPKGDAGLTGRKIIADTYGGMARHGGGAFSGKDPTKVDRSAAYAARWVAKNIVAAGLADRCEVQVAYAIGVAHPVSLLSRPSVPASCRTSGSPDAVLSVFDLRPAAIIHHLDLRRPIYQQTAAYGHFGRPDLDLPWEHVDRAEALRTATSFNGEQLRVPNFRTKAVVTAGAFALLCGTLAPAGATTFISSQTFKSGTRIACVLDESHGFNQVKVRR